MHPVWYHGWQSLPLEGLAFFDFSGPKLLSAGPEVSQTARCATFVPEFSAVGAYKDQGALHGIHQSFCRSTDAGGRIASSPDLA